MDRLLERADIVRCLRRLGSLAEAEQAQLDITIAGGAAIAMLSDGRRSTRDVDVVGGGAEIIRLARRLSLVVAGEEGLSEGWLNDGAKGYVHGVSIGPVLVSAPGITVRTLSPAHLLAMKLSAWRDDVDVADARLLLRLASEGSRDVWSQVELHLLPGRELKARYAYDDLVEALE